MSLEEINPIFSSYLKSIEEFRVHDGVFYDSTYSKEEIIHRNLGIVISCAKRFANSSLQPNLFNELICTGNFTLVRIVTENKFEESKNSSFSTFAMAAITNSMATFLSMDYHGITPYRSDWFSLFMTEIKPFIDNYELETGEIPDVEVIANELRISPVEIDKIVTHVRFIDSTINSFVTPEDLQNKVESAGFERSSINQGEYLLKDLMELVRQGLISEEEYEYVFLYYGLGAEEPYTLEDLREYAFQIKEVEIRTQEISRKLKQIVAKIQYHIDPTVYSI